MHATGPKLSRFDVQVSGQSRSPSLVPVSAIGADTHLTVQLGRVGTGTEPHEQFSDLY